MMKKWIFIPLIALLAISCGDDDNGNGNENTGYITDNLNPSPEQKALLFTSYGFSLNSMPTIETLRLPVEAEFGGKINHMAINFDPDQELFTKFNDTIGDNFSLTTPPSFYLNNNPLANFTMLYDEVETELMRMREPFAGVAHKVRENDTAWVVDNKVEFFKDTAGTHIKTQTYMLANIPAVNYSGQNLDLRQREAPELTQNTDSLSQWITNVPNADSSGNVVKQGATYEHKNVLMTAYDSITWGRAISSYTIFGNTFSKNDVVGTRSTPIRHYFLKKEAALPVGIEPEYNYEFDPVFLSVIWIIDPSDGKYKYVNSYQSKP